jgi:hypothetical protein
MKRIQISVFLLATTVLLLVGCNRPKFTAFSVTVLDDQTLEPLAVARIIPICMGSSPYATNIYLTDAQGRARVMKYARAWSAFNVYAGDYEVAGSAALTNEVLVKLKRAQ